MFLIVKQTMHSPLQSRYVVQPTSAAVTAALAHLAKLLHLLQAG